ncbi:integrase/recombinase xerD homolog [Amphiura filiformis]|uniref:integrase/recombinase xerD homolog n=1 Tax=Amphiura filiformis TaxID=82378 RepID=UPI003B20E8AF
MMRNASGWLNLGQRLRIRRRNQACPGLSHILSRILIQMLVVLVISLLFVATTIQAIDRQLDRVMLEQEDMPAQVRSPLTCVLGAEEWGTGGESVEGTNKRPVSKMAAHMAFPSTSSGKGADGQGAFTDSEVVSGQEETGDDQYRRVLGEVLKASRATSTANKYSKAFSAWQEWCLVHSVSHMPASQDDISRYFIYLYVDQAPFSKIEAAFYSLKWHHDCNPEVNNNPCDSKFLRCLLEGLKRLKAKPVSKKDPVTPDILNKIVFRFGMGSNLMHIRLCAICLISYAGFLRNDELINIRECDVEFGSSFVRIFLVKSKTDQYREGSWVVIAETDSITCPVKMLKRYMQLGCISGSEIFLFRPVTFFKSKNVHKLRDGKMTYSRCRELFKEALDSVGVDAKKFSLHSLRAGGATAAASVGVPDRLFKKHGRWKSEGSKDGYVKESLDNLLSVSKQLGL